MSPTPVMARQLEVTTHAFAAGCQYAADEARRTGVTHAVALQRTAYREIRARFGLSANLAVRAIRRASVAMTAAKRRGRRATFRPTSIDYDARIFAYREKDETVSLTVLGGRIHVPLRLGDYQRTALAGRRPASATVIRRGRSWAIHIVIEEDDAPRREGPPIGVDLGLRNTAATSLGTLHEGTGRQRFKPERQRIRSSLQSKGTRGAKRVLKRLAGAEQRRIRHENHVLSKRIVDEAVKARGGLIRLERLTGIRQRTRVWNQHSNRLVAGWSFGQLQSFIAYKAARAGLAVEYVEPAHTSQACSVCGALGERRGDIFRCTACGLEVHADLNAARNIAAGGAPVNRPESTGRNPSPPSRKPRTSVRGSLPLRPGGPYGPA